MAVRRPLLAPRHLLVLFVGITLLLAAALVWLGSRLIRQDSALERERERETLARAAVSATNSLHERIAAVRSSLSRLASLPVAERRAAMARWGATLGGGALIVELTDDAVTAAPPAVLLYDPAASLGEVSTPAVFARGEQLEFRDRDLRAAAAAYREHLSARGPALRGGALLRLARVQLKEGRTDDALRTYDRLAMLDTVRIHGLPAALLARHAKLGVYRDRRRQREAQVEADSLAASLASGRWRISRGSFEYYYGEALAAAGDPTAPPAEALLLSRAVDSLWRAGPGTAVSAADGRRMLAIDSSSVLVLATARAGTRLMLLQTPAHLHTAWLDSIQPLLAADGVALELGDAAGAPILAARRPAPAYPDAPRLTRAAAESGLPWTISVAVADPRALSREFAARRRLLLAGLVVVILLVLVGTYSVARAMSRELAVARLQSDFVAAVSHEFRTPLTSMRQVAELLESGRVSSDERRAQYHAVLRREGDRLHRLVENLLDFGRMEAGAREFRFERLDAALVYGVVDEFRAGVADAGYEVRLTSGETGPVRGDPEALGRALWNLLDNAVKYSPDYRTIDVSVARDNGQVALSVRDRGVGIPADEHTTIFQDFVRGRSAKTSGVPGTGIGLAMVRHIVQAHGGEVRFTSAVGEGSTFTILLEPVGS